MDAEAVAALCRQVVDLGGVVRVKGGKPTLVRTRRGWEREKLLRLMPLLRDDLPAVLEFFRASTPTTDDPPPGGSATSTVAEHYEECELCGCEWFVSPEEIRKAARSPIFCGRVGVKEQRDWATGRLKTAFGPRCPYLPGLPGET